MTNPYIVPHGTEPLIFHCNHYNLTLQQAIEDAGRWVDAPVLLRDGAEIAAFAMLSDLGEGVVSARMELAQEQFRLQGFGLLDASGVSASGGKASVRNSHYGLAEKNRPGERTTPTCFFAAGYVAAAAACAHGLPSGSFDVRETQCVVLGADHCVFDVVACDAPRQLPPSVGVGELLSDLPERTPRDTNVDEAAIIAAVSSLPLSGNEEGLTPAFGVYLTRHFANYYNHISYEMERSLAGHDLVDSARAILIEAGHVCAFNTFGGIMKSPEWDAVVRPMIQGRTDWVDGMIAIVNALGWGRWSVEELVEHERLVVRVDSSYESNYFLGRFGAGTESRCYLCQGGVAGLMNLLYVGDITTGPELTSEYYARLFSSPESFVATETKCRSKGDDHCEFVAERHRFE